MKFEQTCTISASRAEVWAFLMNMENVANCLPGVQQFNQLDEDRFEGMLRVKVGPVSLSFQGTVQVESRDQAEWRSTLRADAKDRKVGGGVQAHLNMGLTEKGAAETEMHVQLDTHILGKIGEFGQPIIRKKTDTMLQDFAKSVNQQLNS